MTVYTPNLPQPPDDPSDSQDQILQNFQTLNSAYGSSGDHYPWTNTAVSTTRKHAKVTLPGLPTAGFPPGDILPAPAAGDCAIFGQTQAAAVNQTTPFLRRDGLTTNWPLMPIKAFATFTMVANAAVPQLQTLNQFYNITSITRFAPATTSLTFTVVMPNAMRTSDYGVLFMGGHFSEARYTVTNTTTFTFTLDTILDGSKCLVIVLEP